MGQVEIVKKPTKGLDVVRLLTASKKKYSRLPFPIWKKVPKQKF